MSRRSNYGQVSITREDLGPMIKRMAKQWDEAARANEIKFLEQESRWKYEQTEALYFVCDTSATRHQATVIAGLPEQISELKAECPRAESIAIAVRWQYVHALFARQLVRTWEEARARGAKASIIAAESRVEE